MGCSCEAGHAFKLLYSVSSSKGNQVCVVVGVNDEDPLPRIPLRVRMLQDIRQVPTVDVKDYLFK